MWTFTQLTAGAPVAVLTAIKRRSGYMQTLQYNASNQLSSVTDSYGRTLQFTFQNGLLSTMTAPDGGIYQYLYQASRSPFQGSSVGTFPQLVRVVKPGQSPTAPPQNYLYENATFPAALTGIVDDIGNRFATFGYEQWGRPITAQHSFADLNTVTYNDSDNSRVVINPLGQQETYHFAYIQNARKVTRIDRAANGSIPASFSTYSYDQYGRPAGTTDWNGVVTNITNGTHGLPVSITTAAGTPQARTVTYTWDPTYHVPTQIVEPGRTTNFTYANGLLLSKTQTDTTTASVPYSTHGRTRKWTYTYTPTGLVQTVKGPRTDVDDAVPMATTPRARSVSVTNALGQETQITAHDGAEGRSPGRCQRRHHEHDLYGAGRLNTVTVVSGGGNAVTTIDHDAEGQITRITRPDGSILAYTLTARIGWCASATPSTSASTTRSTPWAGARLEQISTAAAPAMAKRSRASSTSSAACCKSIGAASQTTTLRLRPRRQLAQVTDPLSNVTGQSFDTLNRLIQVAAPLSSTTE